MLPDSLPPQGQPVLVEDDGVVLRLDPALQRLIDPTRPPDAAGPLRPHVQLEDVDRLDALEAAIAAGEPAAAQLRLVDRGGAPRWLSVLAVPTRDARGRVAGHVAAWRDVDGEVALREELAASERRFRLLAETASDIVYAAGADRRVTWVSSSIERALGWTPDELVGTWMSDLVHPDDLAWSAARRDRIYAGDPEAEAEGSFVLRLRARDGGYRWVSTTLTTHRDAHGAPVDFTGGMKVIDDVMEERRLLAESEERFRLLAENATDVVYLVRDDAPVWISPSVTRALGWSVDEWLAQGIDVLVHPDDTVIAAQCRSRIIHQGVHQIVELRVRARDGVYHWVQVNAGPFHDADGRLDGLVASFRIIDEQVAARAELERRATYDELTGALKRGPALARIASGDDGFAVLYVDLDGFKDVNDTYGHTVGDIVLAAAAERMRAVVGEHDAIARIGGDEFLVLLPAGMDATGAEDVAGGIRAALEAPVSTPAGPMTVSGSVGVALQRPGETAEAAIARADRAMYRVKHERRSGRDRRA